MLSSTFTPQPLFPTSPMTTQLDHSSSDTEEAVIPTSLPEGMPQLRSMQLNPSDPHATEVTASGQQKVQLPSTDLEDLLLRLQDTYVQSSLQTLQQLLTMGKAAGEKELQSTALKLLVHRRAQKTEVSGKGRLAIMALPHGVTSGTLSQRGCI